MNINVTSNRACLVIRPLDSRLDASAVTAFRAELAKHIDAGKSKVVLDLDNVDFIDSSGLGAIVSALKKIGSPDRLVVCGLNKKTEGIFELTRMDKIFQIYATEAEALDALTQIAA